MAGATAWLRQFAAGLHQGKEPGTLAKCAALALLACWVLLIGAYHEPWGDEAQAWLLARDSGLYELMVERVRYEGSPGLWHLILWIAQRLGLQYAQLYLLSAAFAVAGAAVVLWRAPFPFWMRLATVFSYFFAFQYSVIARSYSVDLLLVPLAAAWFAARSERPLRYAVVIGLIANLNAHGFLAAGVLGLELAIKLWRDGRLFQRASLGAVAAAGLLGLVAMATLWQPADNGFRQPEFIKPWYLLFGFYIREAFVNRVLVFSNQEWLGLDAFVGFIITVFVLRASIKAILATSDRLVFLGVFAVLVGFSTFWYSSPWHSGFLYMFWLMAMWAIWAAVGVDHRRPLAIAFAAVAIFQTSQAFASGVWDLRHTFSPGREVAARITTIRAQSPAAKIAVYGFKGFAVQPWLTGNPFSNYNGGAAKPAYVEWDKGQPWKSWHSPKIWASVVADRPDYVVASISYYGGKTRLMLRQACASGYRLAERFDGHTIWRGARYEDDTILLLVRDPSRQCAPD